MNSLHCALIVLAALAIGALSRSTPIIADRCAFMRCANGPCVNGQCTNSNNQITQNTTCPPNMHEQECATPCPARCDFDPSAVMCMTICVKGCSCDEGFVLDKADGVCIRPEDCPKVAEAQDDVSTDDNQVTQNSTCPPNMHEEECGSACPARCDLDPAASMCMALCVKSCFCDEGFVLEKAGGVCIPQENCPKVGETQDDTVDKCATVRCQAGQICQDGQCIKKMICPKMLFKMPAPKPGCEYVQVMNANGCPGVPIQHCPS